MKIIALLTLLAACGNNHNTSPDAAQQHDTGFDSEAVAPRAVIVAGDFTAGHPGVLSTINPEAMTVETNVGPQGGVGDDTVLRKVGNELFVVNRADGNNVTILDAGTLALIDQLGTGAGSNPQDVVVVGQKLYVPVYGGSGVAVLTRGSNTVTNIDLSADDPDGKPDCASAFLVGTKIFVACELLDATFTPRGPGKVYIIDTASDTVVGSVTMQKQNPFGVFEQSPADSALAGDLVIPADPFSGTGCVERISTGATPASGGCVVSNTDLGGYPSRIAFEGTGTHTTMWMAVSETFPNSALRSYDVGTGTLGAVLSPAAELPVDVVPCPDGNIVVAGQANTGVAGSVAGVRIYKDGVERTTAPLAIGLAPASAHGLACY
jgi:hypothetical protein